LSNVFSNLQNNQKIEVDFRRLFGENCEEKKSQAIKFSAEFQRKLMAKNIYTGRQDRSKEVGMRLKRLDPELLQEFLLKDVKTPVKKEFIKDNFLNKFNEIMKTSSSNLENSIKFLYSNLASR
jgi:hypothetical protein